MSILDSNSDIYYMALELLHILRDEGSYTDTSRLALILDEENFDRLIDNCGGMTITIPTRDEVNRSLKSLVYYQLTSIYHMPAKEALEKSGVSLVDATKVQSRSRRIGKFLRSINPKLLTMIKDKDSFRDRARGKK